MYRKPLGKQLRNYVACVYICTLHAYYTIAPAVCYYNKSAIFIIIRQLEKEGSLLPGSSSPCFLTQKCSFLLMKPPSHHWLVPHYRQLSQCNTGALCITTRNFPIEFSLLSLPGSFFIHHHIPFFQSGDVHTCPPFEYDLICEIFFNIFWFTRKLLLCWYKTVQYFYLSGDGILLSLFMYLPTLFALPIYCARRPWISATHTLSTL